MPSATTPEEEFTYYLILEKRDGKGREVLYAIGSYSDGAAVLRLGGKNAERVFRGLIRALSVYGGAWIVSASDDREVYAVRMDLGPIAGAYLLAVRGAKDVGEWEKVLERVLEGQLPVAKALTKFLEMAIDLSWRPAAKGEPKGSGVPPEVADAVSAALRQFLKKISKAF